MYIKDNYLSLSGNCKDCENSSICKWVSEKARVDKELSSIERTPLSPIIINSTCKNYKKENQKQDVYCLKR